MNKYWKKLLAGASAVALTISLFPSGLTVSAAETETGVPYTAEGIYDATLIRFTADQMTELQVTALLNYIIRLLKMWI